MVYPKDGQNEFPHGKYGELLSLIVGSLKTTSVGGGAKLLATTAISQNKTYLKGGKLDSVISVLPQSWMYENGHRKRSFENHVALSNDLIGAGSVLEQDS